MGAAHNSHSNAWNSFRGRKLLCEVGSYDTVKLSLSFSWSTSYLKPFFIMFLSLATSHSSYNPNIKSRLPFFEHGILSNLLFLPSLVNCFLLPCLPGKFLLSSRCIHSSGRHSLTFASTIRGPYSAKLFLPSINLSHCLVNVQNVSVSPLVLRFLCRQRLHLIIFWNPAFNLIGVDIWWTLNGYVRI